MCAELSAKDKKQREFAKDIDLPKQEHGYCCTVQYLAQLPPGQPRGKAQLQPRRHNSTTKGDLP